MADERLVELGFTRADNGALIAPHAAGMRFIPTGRFYEVSIAIGDGNVITVVVPKIAVKVIQGVRLQPSD